MKTAQILGRVVFGSIAYVVGIVLAGMLTALLHIPTMKSIPGMNAQHAFVIMLAASPLLILGLLPLANGIRATGGQRCWAVAAFLFVTLGLNTLIEAKIFTGMLDGSPWRASFFWVVPALFTAAALTYRTGTAESSADIGPFANNLIGWRVVVAWLAFPVIYFFFGMCVAPFVVPFYQSNSGILGLRIPGFDIIIRTQLLRSAFFLAVSLPFIAWWTKSRGHLIFALGLAHAMTVGVFQLAQATFLPMTLRVAHSLEITADSFAYAAVLTLLLAHKTKTVEPVLSKTSAAA